MRYKIIYSNTDFNRMARGGMGLEEPLPTEVEAESYSVIGQEGQYPNWIEFYGPNETVNLVLFEIPRAIQIIDA